MPTTTERPALPDAGTWMRLSSLLDIALDLPDSMRGPWVESVVQTEPELAGWLQRMLTELNRPAAHAWLEQGPTLPVWVDEVAAPAAATAADTVAAMAGPTSDPPPPPSAETVAADNSVAGATPTEVSSDPNREPVAPPTAAIAATPAEPDSPAAAAATGPAPSEATPQAAAAPASAPSAGVEPVYLAPALASGMQLGPWLLNGPLGGNDRVSVWRARRADGSGAEVALKVPRRWSGDLPLAVRLQSIRTRMAPLQHPQLAGWLDAGISDEGTPWLAYELAEGTAIDVWCRDQRLGLPQRLALMIAALRALHHAHTLGHWHGELTPPCLRITPGGELRVVDLGLDAILHELLGTEAGPGPELRPLVRAYAAPERLRGEPGGSTADIHAAGVVLYELLALIAPQRGDAGLQRPSEAAASPVLRHELRGELDAIVLKAMQPLPAQRYASAAEMADDLQRQLDGLPVLAMGGGLRYALRRLAGRHRLAAGTLVVVGGLALVGAMALLWQGWKSVAERERAVAAQRGTEALNLLLQDVWLETADGVPRDAAGLLARAEAVARSSLKDQPISLARVLALLGRRQTERQALADGRRLLAEAVPLLGTADERTEYGCALDWTRALQNEQVKDAEQRLRRAVEDVSASAQARARCAIHLADLMHRQSRMREAYDTGVTAYEQWLLVPGRPAQLALELSRPLGERDRALGRYTQGQADFQWALDKAALLQQDKGPLGIALREQLVQLTLAAGDAMRTITLADANVAAAEGAVGEPGNDAEAPPAALYLAAAEPRIEIEEFAAARERLERAIALADGRGDAATGRAARCLMGLAALREGDIAAAQRWLSAPPNAATPAAGGTTAPAATATAPALPAGSDAAARGADPLCRNVQAELHLRQGRAAEALREMDRLLASGQLSLSMRCVTALLRAQAALALRHNERALSAALDAMQHARAMTDPYDETQTPKPSFRAGLAALTLAEVQRAVNDLPAALAAIGYAVQQLETTLPDSHPQRRRALALKAELGALPRQ